MSHAVKWIKDTPTGFVVGGYGVVWGGRDLANERFERDTDFWFDRLADFPMTLYQHGQDGNVKKVVVGRTVKKTYDDIGIWIEAQIDQAKEYQAAIRRLIKKGVLGWSSGAVNYLVEKEASGKITSWPIAEWSLTPTPCEPRTLGASELRSLALSDPAIKAVLSDTLKAELNAESRDNLDASDFAYVDSDGGRHLPINDEAHVRAAMSRFNQTGFGSTEDKKQAARKILAKARALGIDVSDDSAIAEAAKFVGHLSAFDWGKALMEGADTAGGYATDADGDNDAEAAVVRHPHDAMSHAHSHMSGPMAGQTHSHPHDHADGSVGHDGDAHDHATVAAPMKGKARKDVDADDDEDDGADYEGSYEDLHADLEALVNPSGPLTSSYNRVVATYPGHVVFCSWEDGDESYFRVEYAVGADGEPMLTGQPTAVEQAWQPVKAVALVSLELNARDIGRRQAAFLSGTKGLLERRVKEGREFSTRNESALMDHADRLDGHAKESTDMAGSIRGMVTASRTARDARTKAEYLATPEARKLALDLLQLYAATLEPETIPA